MEGEIFQSREQAGSPEPIAPVGVVPDAPLMQDGFQAVFMTGNGRLAVASTPQGEPQFLVQPGAPGGLPGGVRHQRGVESYLQVRSNGSSILAQVGNASAHNGVWTAQDVGDSRRAREGVQSPVCGLRLVQVAVG